MQTKIEIFSEKAPDLLYQRLQSPPLSGYDNPLYFSNVFKKFYGKSPRQYRKELLSPARKGDTKEFQNKS
ncbi:MAG: AraC family transcriptional regulator [Lentisphaeria bacterium]|nr:AraC family transcriptional regulator [Lentisphaeria bacterium]